MTGIDLNQPIIYKSSSLRFFEPQEHHIRRFCREDVLLLVYEGVLRFSEDGTEYEVGPGEYYIQRKNTLQEGKKVSDEPNYLYVHFLADWAEEDEDKSINTINGELREILPKHGRFNYMDMKFIIDELDRCARNHGTYVKQTALFYELLAILFQSKTEKTVADRMAGFIEQKYCDGFTLAMLAEEFHFSKNHVINLFKQKYRMTPFEYQNSLRVKKAKRLLEVTSMSTERIAEECGFKDYAYFYRMFRKTEGIAPAEWRKRKRME